MRFVFLLLQAGLDSEDPAERRAAQQRLIALGPAAIPQVRQAADSSDPEVRMLANEILEEIVCEPGRKVFDRQLAVLKKEIRKNMGDDFTITEDGYRLEPLDAEYLRKIFPSLKFYECSYTLNGEKTERRPGGG